MTKIAFSNKVFYLSKFYFSRNEDLDSLSKFELTVNQFELFLRWRSPWLCCLDWSFKWLNMQKGPFLLKLLVFEHIVLKIYRVEFFGQCPHRDVLIGNLRLFVKVICVLLDQFLMCHVDENCRNATAPLFFLHFIPWLSIFSGTLMTTSLYLKNYKSEFGNNKCLVFFPFHTVENLPLIIRGHNFRTRWVRVL